MSNAMLRIEGLMHRAWVMSEIDGEKVALSRVNLQTKATARQEYFAFRVNLRTAINNNYRAVV